MADEEQLKILLQQGVAAWNDWREKNPEVSRPDLSRTIFFACIGTDLKGANLSGADLSNANLDGVNLSEANLNGAVLSGAVLRQANLSRAILRQADLGGANLSGADLSGADLWKANLSRADLWKANLSGALSGWVNLGWADLREANLTETGLPEAELRHADLSGANLSKAELSGAVLSGAVLWQANLSGADLTAAQLVGTDLRHATLTGSKVYGVSVWDIQVDDRTKQQNLIITDHGEPKITVDNIKVAQFIYLLLDNQEIRDVIDTITSKAVLILGRFSEERKRVLDALREELRGHNYLPILFDFLPSPNQATLGTIKTLASMARFVVADLTDARSVLQELGAVVPAFPSVAVRLMIKKSEHEYGMLDEIRLFRSVVEDTYEYEDTDKVIASIRENIIAPAEAKVEELRRLIRPTAR